MGERGSVGVCSGVWIWRERRKGEEKERV